MISDSRSQELSELAGLLVEARSGQPLTSLEGTITPLDLEEAYFVQDRMAARFGPVGGWKIGATSATDVPFFAPMPRAWMLPSHSVVESTRSRLRGVEVEAAFILKRDLPPRSSPYERSEVLAAVESVHPAIEIVESGLSDPLSVPAYLKFADLQVNGGLVYGPAYQDGLATDWSTETAVLQINGEVRVRRSNSNSAGPDLVRMLIYLANEGAGRTGGLQQGQWITTGSWTGLVFCRPGDRVQGSFSAPGEVSFAFE